MTIEWKVIIALAIIVIVLFLLLRRTQRLLEDVSFAKLSLSSKYGKMTEQFLPFLADYPYNPQLFRFLGTPIDGIQFTDDEIIFMEFKTAASQLSASQKRIRELIERKQVRFHELRIE